jgi:hypothetical protein
VYDNTLRKRTGSYYTPPEVVTAMVNLVDECLRGPLFERPAGFAAKEVVVADPAVGTGTFLLGVLRRIAQTVEEDEGAGAVRGAIEAAAKRIIGFEMQFGPFAVAQLRLIAELQTLMQKPPLPELRLYITDTLGNPFIEEEWLPQIYEPVAKSRRDANTVKKETPITVVIGNPPYKEKAEGRGGWIEKGSGGKLVAPLDWWKAPSTWRVGAHGKHLKIFTSISGVGRPGRFLARVTTRRLAIRTRTKKELSALSPSPASLTAKAFSACGTTYAAHAQRYGLSIVRLRGTHPPYRHVSSKVSNIAYALQLLPEDCRKPLSSKQRCGFVLWRKGVEKKSLQNSTSCQ